jgi:hypothetical protein
MQPFVAFAYNSIYALIVRKVEQTKNQGPSVTPTGKRASHVVQQRRVPRANRAMRAEQRCTGDASYSNVCTRMLKHCRTTTCSGTLLRTRGMCVLGCSSAEQSTSLPLIPDEEQFLKNRRLACIAQGRWAARVSASCLSRVATVPTRSCSKAECNIKGAM